MRFCSKCGSEVAAENAANIFPKSGIEPQAQPNDQEWFFYEGSEKRGPYSYQQMTGFVKQGKIQRETMVWTQGITDWTAAEKSPLVQALGSVAPAAPIGMISDKWMWALATLPWLVDRITTLLAIKMGLSGVTLEIVPLVCVIATNIYFANKDFEEVKKTGRDVEQWMYSGFFIVVVYLFVRASKTSKNYIPAILNFILWFGPGLLS